MQYRFVSVNPAFMNCCTLSGMTSVRNLSAALPGFFALENVEKLHTDYFVHTQAISVTSSNSGFVLWLRLKCRISSNWSNLPFAQFLVILSHSVLGSGWKKPCSLTWGNLAVGKRGFQRRVAPIRGQAPPEYFGMANICFKLKKNPNQTSSSLPTG